MKLAVVGSRTFNNYDTLEIILNELFEEFEFHTIVSGGAEGADKLSEKYAKRWNKDLIVFPADWEKYGKRAGFIRNADIWKEADLGIAFWDGKSTGTAHSFDLAKKAKKRLFVYNFVDKDFYEVKYDRV